VCTAVVLSIGVGRDTMPIDPIVSMQ